MIAIIAVLVGLLLPAVQGAREAARTMDCQSHRHPFGIAVQQDFDDWNGLFFLHHRLEEVVSTRIRAADSFAEVSWSGASLPGTSGMPGHGHRP